MRTVLSIEAFAGNQDDDVEQLTVRVIRSPFNVDKADRSRLLQLDPGKQADWGSPDGVRSRGRAVRESLQSHPGVGEVLRQLFTTPIGTTQSLFVMLSRSEAEQISWETLCDGNDKFVALDARWPIGRITDPMSGVARPPAELKLPVRMMVLISALGIKGQVKEWQVLRDGIGAARAAGLPVVLKVMVGEPSLHAAIAADIAAGLANVELAAIEKAPTRVIQDIRDWQPNIVHVFCHGRSDATGQAIELANGIDYADAATTTGSVRIGVDALASLGASLANPWLLVLNCCSGGQAATNLQSIAYQVVSNGFPAAVAMLEPVDAGDAHEFARAFYRSLFASLAKAAQALQQAVRVPFEWSEAMVDARTAISEAHDSDSSNAREWTLPVLYVRGIEPFTFDRPPPGPEADTAVFKAKARTVAEWLQAVGQQKDESVRQAVMASALDDVPKNFWPKVDGSF